MTVAHMNRVSEQLVRVADESLGMWLYGRMRHLLTPGLEHSQVAYARALELEAAHSVRWLDLGCGHSILPDWMGPPDRALRGRAIGIDLDGASLRAHTGLKSAVCGDVHVLPFRSGSFDLITANMVLEHVAEPRDLFRDLFRVLIPGGRVLIHTPNASGYTTRLARLLPERVKSALACALQTRRTIDVYRTHYRANTEAELRDLASHTGFVVDRIEHVLTSAQLWRIPPLLPLEMLWIHRISRPESARKRPVLIAVLSRRLG